MFIKKIIFFSVLLFIVRTSHASEVGVKVGVGVGICIPIISLLAFGGVKAYQYRYDNLKGGEHASKNRFNVNENNVVPMFGSNSIGEILIYSNDGDIHAVKDEPDLVYKKMKSRDKSSVLKKMSKMSRSELHKSDVVVAPVEVDGDGYFMRKAYGVTLAAIDPQVIEQNQNTILRQLIIGMKDISEVGGYKPMVEHGGNVLFDASNKKISIVDPDAHEPLLKPCDALSEREALKKIEMIMQNMPVRNNNVFFEKNSMGDLQFRDYIKSFDNVMQLLD